MVSQQCDTLIWEMQIKTITGGRELRMLLDGQFEAGRLIPLQLGHLFQVQEGEPSACLAPLFLFTEPGSEYVEDLPLRRIVPEIVAQEGGQRRGTAGVVQLLFDDMLAPERFQAMARGHSIAVSQPTPGEPSTTTQPPLTSRGRSRAPPSLHHPPVVGASCTGTPD
jgi:hypothetical protein